MMSFRRLRNWPPVWSQRGPKDATLQGEIGNLIYVHFSRESSTRFYLVIDHEGAKYVGSLIFDDPVFCGQICTLLKGNIGRSIKEIGDLDLSYTL
jgi:hypothetical protein